MKHRQTVVIEGSSVDLDRIIDLFEVGELYSNGTLKILDIGITSVEQATTTPIDLYRMWLDSLRRKGFQPAVRSVRSTSTNKKVVRLQNISIEIAIAILPLADIVEIQIFLQIRPVDGKGHLPADLQVAILDELGEVILHKSTSDRDNLLDLTADGDLICQLADRFQLTMSLGNETIIENFPS
jgi:Protein of unknown function (DUF1822)